MMRMMTTFMAAVLAAGVSAAELPRETPAVAPDVSSWHGDIDVVAVYYPHWYKYPKGTEWFGEKWDEGEWAFIGASRADASDS